MRLCQGIATLGVSTLLLSCYVIREPTDPVGRPEPAPDDQAGVAADPPARGPAAPGGSQVSALSPARKDALLPRVHGPNVFPIQPQYQIPQMPLRLQGLKIVVRAREVGEPPAGKSSSQVKRECLTTATSIFGALTWAVVDDPAPHDLVVGVTCGGSASFVRIDGQVYVVQVPVSEGRRGVRLETPTGEPIDELRPSPDTLSCPPSAEIDPYAAQASCARALQQYYLAHIASEIAGSSALASYVREHRTPD